METFKLDNYLVFKKEIGRGSFSTVYKGIDQNNNGEVAIKKINNKALSKMRNYIDCNWVSSIQIYHYFRFKINHKRFKV